MISQNGQLVVEGPDGKAATAIANQLSTGQAKLANIGGKQVSQLFHNGRCFGSSGPLCRSGSSGWQVSGAGIIENSCLLFIHF
jgi:hypothetical protein